jgi:hypothetical protein
LIKHLKQLIKFVNDVPGVKVDIVSDLGDPLLLGEVVLPAKTACGLRSLLVSGIVRTAFAD